VTVHAEGVLDTNIIVALNRYDPAELPETFLITAITLGELFYGQLCAAVRAAGRQPRPRSSDLMIAATAASNALPLYTANPDDFRACGGWAEIVAVHSKPNDL